MKINTHVTDTASKIALRKSDIKLSIGMIVKNEEKTLERCLRSLIPLLNAVPSELIITDTGSTDRTVEIAKKFTNHIIHFKWCDDFAAARNTGLNEARGEWFMFIDSDEWFEDVSEIIDFFTSGECDNYHSVSYRVRNYRDFAGKTFFDSYVVRIVRVYSQMQFQNKLHEAIAGLPPLKFVDSYVHHYGYVFNDPEKANEKIHRNMSILENMLEQDPNNLKLIYQLSREYFDAENMRKALEISKKGLAIESNESNRVYKVCLQQLIINAHYKSRQYQKVLSILNEFLPPEKAQKEVRHLDFYYWGLEAAFRLEQYEKAIQLGQEYLEVYRKYKENILDMTQLINGVHLFNMPNNKEEVIRIIGLSYLSLDNENQAYDWFKQLDLSVSPFLVPFHYFCFTLAKHSGNWSIISDYYRKILSLENQSKMEEFINFTELFIYDNPDFYTDILSAIAASVINNTYTVLCRMRFSEKTGNKKAALEDINYILRNESEWNLYLYDLFYFAMKEMVDISQIIQKIDMDTLKYYWNTIQKCHPDIITIIPDYFRAYTFKTLKGLYWTICLKEKVILQTSEMDEETFINYFKDFAEQTSLYVHSIYRDEIFEPNTISVLPRFCQFGYYMDAAFSAQKYSDDTLYLKNLHSALSSYPVMQKPISLLLDYFEQKKAQENSNTKEFFELASQLKKQIESMIACGKLQEAGSVTVQLAALLPDDEDVKRFQRITHTEPKMQELASRIPQ
jgi:glycosyltransferase involved in cell wall biosynthesis